MESLIKGQDAQAGADEADEAAKAVASLTVAKEGEGEEKP
jgi:hypothetical protein